MYRLWKHYDTTSTLYEVTDLENAMKAIKMIIRAGRGGGSLGPHLTGHGQAGPLLQVEELVCKRYLDVKHRHNYFNT